MSAISSHDSYLPSGIRLFWAATSFPISPWDMVLCSLARPSPEVNRCMVCNDSKHEAHKNKMGLGISDNFFSLSRISYFISYIFISICRQVKTYSPDEPLEKYFNDPNKEKHFPCCNSLTRSNLLFPRAICDENQFAPSHGSSSLRLHSSSTTFIQTFQLSTQSVLLATMK